MLLKYILDRQRIEHRKRDGINWMMVDADTGFGMQKLSTALFSPPHTEDGFHNQMFYKAAVSLIDSGKLLSDQHVAALAAVFATFMNPEFLEKVVELVGEEPDDWIRCLPRIIAEFEDRSVDEVDVPLKAYWARGKAQVTAMKLAARATLDSLKDNPNKFPMHVQDVVKRYQKQLDFVRLVSSSDLDTSEHTYIIAH